MRMDDENAMGKIRIVKTDCQTKEKLNGAVFEIRAAEDIVTPDGTLHLEKGDLADTIVTGQGEDLGENGDGMAYSKELFLGKYVLKEKQQPSGYMLDQEEYPLELVYEDQNTPIVIKTLHLKNTPVEMKHKKRCRNGRSDSRGKVYSA